MSGKLTFPMKGSLLTPPSTMPKKINFSSCSYIEAKNKGIENIFLSLTGHGWDIAWAEFHKKIQEIRVKRVFFAEGLPHSMPRRCTVEKELSRPCWKVQRMSQNIAGRNQVMPSAPHHRFQIFVLQLGDGDHWKFLLLAFTMLGFIQAQF